MYDFTNVDPVKTCAWLVLPTVYDESLSYGEQLNKFCKALNELIENNNNIPDYVAEMIQQYITSGAIDEVVRNILASYILNVKYPPKGINPAVGDGSADDTNAIQGCIDYAFNQGGGCVYFPYGKYLSRSLTLRSGVSLVGFDRYSTRIVQRGGDTKPLVSGGNVQNVQISNLTLDGNNEVQTDDLDVVNVLGKDCLFTNLIIKSGFQCLVYNGLGGDLQVNNVVFGGAVKKVAVINGKDSVQFSNVKFNELGKIQGECVLEVGASDGIYRFSNKAICPTCIINNGDRNTYTCDIVNATNSYIDNGSFSNFNILGVEITQQLVKDKYVKTNNYRENINDSKITNAKNLTENIIENKIANAKNLTADIAQNVSLKCDKLTENTTNKVISAKDITETCDSLIITSKNITENISNVKTLTADAFKIDTNKTIIYKKHIENSHYSTIPMVSIDNIPYNLMSENNNTIEKFKMYDKYDNTIKEIQKEIIAMTANNFGNVKSFGAKGDGVTDDTQAIQDAMNSSFDVVFFPKGVYKTNSIKIPSNKFVLGSNATLSQLGNNIFINASDGVTGGYVASENIIIFNLTFDGNNEQCTSVAFGHSNNCKIIHCHFKRTGAWHCIELNGCLNCLIDSCLFTDYGMTVVNTPTEMVQLDSMISSVTFPWFGPYDLTSCLHNTIQNCTFDNSSKAMTEISTNTYKSVAIGNHSSAGRGHESARETSVINCKFQALGVALKFTSCVGLLVSDCYANFICCFYENYNSTDRCAFLNFMNNYIYGTHGDANSFSERHRGINFSYGSFENTYNVTISNNVIVATWGHGIAAGGNNVKVMNNRVNAGWNTDESQFDIYMGYNDIDCTYMGNICENHGFVYMTHGSPSNILIANNTGKLTCKSTVPNVTTFANNIFTSLTGTIGSECKILNQLVSGTLQSNQNV